MSKKNTACEESKITGGFLSCTKIKHSFDKKLVNGNKGRYTLAELIMPCMKNNLQETTMLWRKSQDKVLKQVWVQLLVGLVFSLLSWLILDGYFAYSALEGVLAMSVANFAMVLVMLRVGKNQAQKVAGSMFAGMMVKWLVLALAVLVVAKLNHVNWLAFLCGVIAVQLGVIAAAWILYKR